MIFIYVVCASRDEARKIGKACVTKHLAACANYHALESVYFWKGKLVEDKEYALILKTRESNYNKVEKLVKKIHSYEVPCICAWKIGKVEKNYLEWVDQESKK